MPQAPAIATPAATNIPLYQPPLWNTGEIVMVAGTGGTGANFRVAPRARARIWRVVPEGQPLETVGAEIRVDAVPWAYVREQQGTFGWIVAHDLETIAQLPGGRVPARPRGAQFSACPQPTNTPAAVLILIPVGTPFPAQTPQSSLQP